jgi:hypothetical protein
MQKEETPRLQKIQYELDKIRRSNNLNNNQTGHSTTSKPSQSVGKTKPDSNSLAEQSESIKTIWIELCSANMDLKIQADVNRVTELPLSAILDFLVKEGVSLDRDKARHVVNKQIGDELMSENKVSMEEFEKLFCKGMFKKALIKIAQTFD